MRSRASVRGIPLHPALVHYPFAFLTGGFLFDLAGVLGGRPSAWVAGAWLVLAGTAAALVAAVPGLLDYLHTVPPNSSGKRRATRHLAANLSAVTLFGTGWLLRGGASVQPGLATLMMEGTGTLLLFYGGYLGGVLVSRNQIGIDHRYAEAGKWREGTAELEPGGTAGIPAPGLGVNQMLLLHVDGRRIVLGRTESGYVAFDDHCTHRGGTLAGGVLSCGTVQCPWHGSRFDVETGSVRSGPATAPIRSYTVEARGSRPLIHLSE